MLSILFKPRRPMLCLVLLGGLALPGACTNTAVYQKHLARENVSFVRTVLEYIRPLENGRLMPENWISDNCKFDDQGRPVEFKLAGGDVGTIWLDLDGTGLDGDRMEKPIQNFPLYAVRFVDTRNDSAIWLRAIPYPAYAENAKFAVLMRRFLDDFTFVGYSATCIWQQQYSSDKRRYAARIVSADDAMVAGYPAYAAVLEAANISNALLSEETPLEYLEVVMIRTDLLWEFEGSARAFPVLLIAAYQSYGDDFEDGRRVFRELLARLRFPEPDELPDETKKDILNCSPELNKMRFKMGVYSVEKLGRDSKQRKTIVLKDEFQVRSPDLDRNGIACVKRAITEHKPKKTGGSFVVYRHPQNRNSKTFVPQAPVLSNAAGQQKEPLDSNTDLEGKVETPEEPHVSETTSEPACNPPCKTNELCTKAGHCVPAIE